MLKIWYYAGTEYLNDAPSYFDNVYEDEWIEDAFYLRDKNVKKIVECFPAVIKNNL